jgi:hypothetical protein
MGAVYNQSLQDVQKVSGSTDQKMRKLGRKMPETVIMGSMEICRQNAGRFERETENAVNTIVEEKIALTEAEANEYELETRMNLDVEREQGEVEEHQEEDSDDEFRP